MYEELAAKDGISLTSSPHAVRDFSMTAFTGDYRRVLARPGDLHWDVMSYDEPQASLATTDLELLQGCTLPDLPVLTSGAAHLAQAALVGFDNPHIVSVADEDVGECKSDVVDGQMMALRLQVTLPPSCYATMLIRELLKSSTATDVHRSATLAQTIG